jgi:asparagine synthase (glutamine-hydrolysing)
MCGIAGAIDLQPGLHGTGDLVVRMTQSIAHRGPDDDGLFVDGPVALGHRRLSIIDLSEAGHQPMRFDRYWLTYNGEVYNYLEIAEELTRSGHEFASASDTEVLLHAYAEWGARALDRLNGMFAFAVWDSVRQTLFCARDRFGVKPFYWTVAGGRFLFASELKALFVDPAVPRRPNEPRLHDFLARGLADHTDETMFEGIRQLRPGHWFEATPDDGPRTPRRWYRATPRRPTADAVRRAIGTSVSLRLRSDVPVGTCLSGGLDSSTVVALSSALRRERRAEPPASFSARCDDPRLDEGRYIEAVVADTGSRHHELTPDDDDLLANLDRLLWHMDEPFHAASVFGHWKVMQLARDRGVTVLLDGQGGDEVFGGYHHLYPAYFLDLAVRGRLVRLVHELRERRRVHGVPVRRSLVHALKALAPARLRARARVPWLAAQPPGPPAPLLRRSLALRRRADLEVSPLPAYLHHVDRNSMCFSLESRVPLLDYHVVELGLGASGVQLLRGGRTKALLRDAMRPMLPRIVVERSQKQGFTVDQASWLDGRLGEAVRETFLSESMASRPCFEAAALPAAALSGATDAVWRSFVVERWFRLFIDPARPVAPPQAASRTILAPS